MNATPYDPLKYDIINHIKIYTGTTTFSNEYLNNKIAEYKCKQSLNKILTDLSPSTLTVKGKFSCILFNEEDIIDMLSTPNGGHIIKICCNYGIIINPNPDYIEPPPKVRISNRGRKPKDKPKTKRKLQGSGKYFSSQITFEIYNPDVNKIYKIKVFRNGGFQVPGIIYPDMRDLIRPLKTLLTYLKQEFCDNFIRVQYCISVMRNYICKLQDPYSLIKLNVLEQVLNNYKKNEDNSTLYNLIENIEDTSETKTILQEYIHKSSNTIYMAEIQNNCERYFGLIIKFYRPVPWKYNKRTTIKILRSGKVNIDGSNSVEESNELYYWLETILSHSRDSVIYNSNIEEIKYDSYDIGSGESRYDDDYSEDFP